MFSSFSLVCFFICFQINRSLYVRVFLLLLLVCPRVSLLYCFSKRRGGAFGLCVILVRRSVCFPFDWFFFFGSFRFSSSSSCFTNRQRNLFFSARRTMGGRGKEEELALRARVWRGGAFCTKLGRREELRRYGEGIFFSSENWWVGGKQMEREEEDVRKGFGGKRKEGDAIEWRIEERWKEERSWREEVYTIEFENFRSRSKNTENIESEQESNNKLTFFAAFTSNGEKRK